MKLVGIVGGIFIGLLGLGTGVVVFAHESLKASGEVPIYYTEIIVNPPPDLVDTEERLPPPVIETTPSVTVFPTLAPTTPLPTKIPTRKPSPTVTPSTAPSPTMQPTVTPVMTHMDVKTLIALMARQYEVDEDTLLHIAHCESSLNPLASNLTYAGLYQFSPGAWQTYRNLMGKDANSDLRTDPLAAIETAAYVLSIGKEGIWPSCLP